MCQEGAVWWVCGGKYYLGVAELQEALHELGTVGTHIPENVTADDGFRNRLRRRERRQVRFVASGGEASIGFTANLSVRHQISLAV